MLVRANNAHAYMYLRINMWICINIRDYTLYALLRGESSEDRTLAITDKYSHDKYIR